jgi:spermidine synthase
MNLPMAQPWIVLASETTADGVLELRKRGERDYLITIGGRILMSSAAHRSEVALAEWGCALANTTPAPHVLVSGLGMGFTLQATLGQLDATARVDVAELNPIVIDWCKGPLGALTASSATDRRVKMHVTDVAEHIARYCGDGADKYDALVLDMYEGPQARPEPRHPLYGERAARNMASALKSRGRVAVWCEAQSPGFEKYLEAAGFHVQCKRAGKGARVHMVYIADKGKRYQ